MAAKSVRAARGELSEPSVVQTPRARALGGVPNAAIGVAFYAALALVTLFGHGLLLRGALAAAVAAAAFSAYLAYSLLYVTRMACVYCWTSHVVNWLLVPLTLALAIGRP